MTIDEILGRSTEDFEKMSDAQLHEFLLPLLAITRPENQNSPSINTTTKRTLKPTISKEVDAVTKLRNILLKFGETLPE